MDVEEKTALVYEAVQYPVSIGCGSNIPGFEERFFCRENSSPEAGYAMVREFLEFVEKAHAKHIEMVPETIITAIERISEAIKGKFSKERSKLKTYNRFLTNMLRTSLFGYNSGRYDVPGKFWFSFQFDKYFIVLIPYIRLWANEKHFDFNVTKRNNTYIQFQIGQVVFRDI